ncbi:hypothetical protein ACLE20_03995 [Rhizobium sp. YIM 134829]|uniref:hypothetical protein n=1 Tax=Rhizobium sp. YIM 134829 TaxID=3390453 RepID=UPI003978E76B
MSDTTVKTLYAVFSTREAADLAVEHLVQQHGIDRSDVFIEPQGAENTAGVVPSGSDRDDGNGEGARDDGALEGGLQVSVDLALADLDKAEAALREAGARQVERR